MAEICKVYKRCGGCQLQHMTYEEQLAYKQRTVKRLMGRYCKVEQIIGMDNPYHYRNKVQAAFTSDRFGNVISGVYQSNSHRVVKVSDCQIEDRKADEIICTIRNLCKDFKIAPYDEDSRRGLLRHVLIKRGFTSGEIMVVLVTASPILPAKNNFVKALLKKHPKITTIIQNINKMNTNLVLGDREIILYGDGFIKDTLCGCVFRISSRSFYQINPVQTEILYSKAIEFAELTGKELCIDAYCGIGTIGIIAAQKAKNVIGVELNTDAFKDAIINAKINKTKNIYFYNADAGKFMVGMAEDNQKADVVFMDPPRAGSDVNFLSSVVKLSPKKVVYVSCNPETLARDTEYLVNHGYEVKKIQPVDMFPHTNHVETVVQLVRKNPDTHIDFEINLDEFDLTASEAKATYHEIKDYVLDKFGLKVSTLYISQVKAKCGIIERENYNKGEGKSKVPQCPPEKEKAIINALKHFKMI